MFILCVSQRIARTERIIQDFSDKISLLYDFRALVYIA